MKKLSTEVLKQWYFIKESVVFDIKASNPKKDSCAFSGQGVTWEELKDDDGKVTGHSVDVTTANVPYIKVVDNTVESEDLKKKEFYYYLDCFIKDGDKYICGKLQDALCKFSKTIHNDTGDDEGTISIYEYYKELLNEELENIVERNFSKDFEWFEKNLVANGFPAYAIAGDDYEVDGFEQIDFNEEMLQDIKNRIVWREIVLAAERIAKQSVYKIDENGKKYAYEVLDDFDVAVEENVVPMKEGADEEELAG